MFDKRSIEHDLNRIGMSLIALQEVLRKKDHKRTPSDKLSEIVNEIESMARQIDNLSHKLGKH